MCIRIIHVCVPWRRRSCFGVAVPSLLSFSPYWLVSGSPATGGMATGQHPKHKTTNNTGVAPNATSYTGAIAACSKAGDGDKALEWLNVMSEQGIAPEVRIVRTPVTGTAVLLEPF